MMEAQVSYTEEWIRCPRCRAKTRVRIREDTVIVNLPMFCPKCKGTFLVGARDKKVEYKTTPDA